MNIILKDLGMILSGLVGAGIFIWVKGLITKRYTKILARATEQYAPEKLKEGLTTVFDKVKWAKTLTNELSIRTWIIRLTIIGLIMGVYGGYMYYKGLQGKPVNFNLQYDKEFSLKLDGQTLHKPKNSSQLEVLDKDGNRIKIICAKDIPDLYKKLCPYGFILEPYFSEGIAITDKGIKQDIGIGASWFKYYKWRLGNWLSNNGVYVGVDYKITENTSLNGGIGKGYKGDNLVEFGIHIKI